jgi:hypothetical protein
MNFIFNNITPIAIRIYVPSRKCKFWNTLFLCTYQAREVFKTNYIFTMIDFQRATLAPTNLICQSDLDCPSNSICFSGVRTAWVRNKYGLTSSFCECSRATLYSGYPECTEATSAYYGELAIRCIMLILASLVVLVIIWDILRLHRIGEMKLVRPTVQAGIVVLFACVCHIISISIYISCQDPFITPTVVAGFKICRNTSVLLVFTVFATLFSFLSTAMVALVWIALVERTNSMKKTAARGKSDKLKKALYGLQFIYFIALTASAATLQLSIAIIATIPYMLIILVGYIIGGRALARLLTESFTIMSQNRIGSEQQQQTTASISSGLYRGLKRVERVSRLTGSLLCIEILLMIVTVILLLQNGGAAYEENFFFRPLGVSILIEQVIMILMNCTLAGYLHFSISGTVNAFSSANKISSGDANVVGGGVAIPAAQTPLQQQEGHPQQIVMVERSQEATNPMTESKRFPTMADAD